MSHFSDISWLEFCHFSRRIEQNFNGATKSPQTGVTMTTASGRSVSVSHEDLLLLSESAADTD